MVTQALMIGTYSFWRILDVWPFDSGKRLKNTDVKTVIPFSFNEKKDYFQQHI